MDTARRSASRVGNEGVSSAVEPPLPRAMAALGDSITQGFGAGPQVGQPAAHLSWSTGYEPDDPIQSHYERLLKAGAALEGRAHNLAVPGARMSDAPRQAAEAVRTGAEYVTLLMGANDLCVWSKALMTSLPKFERDLRRTIECLSGGLPGVMIYILSIPDLYQAWELVHDNPTVKSTWGWNRPCRSMFARTNSDRDRQRVRRLNEAYNRTLENMCDEYSNCHFDSYAVFLRPYDIDDLGADFFHPSRTGQRDLAEVSWRNGLWPDR
jgi:lysophospholipase L1-like esterase